MSKNTKVSRKTKLIQNAKGTNDVRTPTKKKATHKPPVAPGKKEDLRSSSFGEPVLRILRSATTEALESGQTGRSVQNEGIKVHFTVFHRRQDPNDEKDIAGSNDITKWKRSAGLAKSWKVCKRFRLTPDYLERLIQSNDHPVAFGWRFSTIQTPSMFAKGKGMHVNKPPKSKKTNKSTNVSLEDLERCFGFTGRRPRRHEVAHSEKPTSSGSLSGGFLRLTFSCNTAYLTSEMFIASICLTSRRMQILVISSLLWNESHADVYLVRDSGNPHEVYHAHAFLKDGLSGNWQTFMRRKMDRLRRSHAFYAETDQAGRKIIVLAVDQESSRHFQSKNMEQEFPPLPGPYRKNYKPCQKRYRISYATAVTGKTTGALKSKLKPNQLGYKAWQTRQGRRKQK